MASIYESIGPQVQLRGPQESAGFRPVQALDRSQQVLQAADARDAAARRDLEALAGFSKTLTEYLTEEAKAKTKQAYLQGLAGLAEGERTLAPQVIEQYKQDKAALAGAVQEDIQLANKVAEKDPLQADVLYSRAPSLQGWFNYGRAVREAQVAASEAEGFLDSFSLGDTQIPITLPDGTTKTLVASQITSPEELAAVMSAARTQFLTSRGLDKINPAILVENLFPRLDEAVASVQGRRLKEIQENLRQERLDEIDATVSRALPGIQNAEQAQEIITKAFEDAFVVGRNRRAANEVVSGFIFGALESLAESNPTEAARIRDLMQGIYVNPNKKNLGTLGERFEDNFTKIDQLVAAKQKEAALLEEETTKKQFIDIIGAFDRVQMTGTLEETQRAYDQAEKRLIELSANYPTEATATLNELKGRSRNYSVQNEKAIVENIRDPYQLEALLIGGYIKQEAFDSLKEIVPSSDGKSKIVSLQPELLNFFLAQFVEEAGLSGINPESARGSVSPFAKQLVEELIVYAYGLELEARKQGKTLSRAALRTELVQRGLDQMKNNVRFQIKTGADGRPVLKPELFNKNFMSDTIRLENGTTVKQLQARALSQLPRVISSTRATAIGSDILEQNIKAIEAGGQPDERVTIVAAAAGISPIELLRQEGKRVPGFNPASLDNSKAQQTFKANYALDPTAARILANPRSSRIARQRAQQALDRARNRQEAAASAGTGDGGASGAFGGKAFETLRAAVVEREGGAAGYNAANRGTPNDTPGGVPGLTNMTLRQVLSTYNQGYNVLGGYQFKKTTLEGLIRVNGLSLDTKFTPQVQDQLFESYFTKGANNRRRLSGYVNGQNNDLQGALEDLALEFAVVRQLNGRGAWDGVSGNKASIDAAQILRQMRDQNIGRGKPVDMSSKNIQSIEIEVPGRSFQPGFDLWFADKRFGAVLPGRVKEIRRSWGNYGNMIIVESTDPATGEKLDVLYAHLGSIAVAPGQAITTGQLLGTQGGTGRVESVDGTIASVDFLHQAPKGSNSMKPYRYWRELANRLKAQIEGGGRF